MSVGGSEFSLTLSPEPVYGSYDTDRAEREVVMEITQFGRSTDEVGIGPAKIALHAAGAASATNAFPKAGTECV
jgi:hypothetical protein